jgi:hypothetical protein
MTGGSSISAYYIACRDQGPDIMTYFTAAASKYKQQYSKAPVLIIDNANKLPPTEPGLLES